MNATNYNTNSYRRKLNGYRCSHRNKWLLIQSEVLTLQELALLEFYLDIFDFDKYHQNYGLIEVDFSKIVEIFNTSERTIRNWHNGLLHKGFIRGTGTKKLYSILTPERYLPAGKWAGKASEYSKSEKNCDVSEILKSVSDNRKTLSEKLKPNSQSVKPVSQKLQSQASCKQPKAIGSYKDDVSFTTTLSKDDIEWINEIVKEEC
jgi:hypothetical protein